MKKTATISDDGLYRYVLGRRWSDEEDAFATFVMLNPSTADAEVDDPTIRRCISFAQSWGMGGLRVVNLYALRATRPEALWNVADPVGPENDYYLTWIADMAKATGWPLVAAWGANAKQGRVQDVLGLRWMQFSLQCLGITKAGAPRHPLYVKGATPLIPWAPPTT